MPSLPPASLALLCAFLIACGPDPACGDGVLDSDEQCDDGNTRDADGCQSDCTLPSCGDGIVDVWEACDAGEDNSVAPDAACRPDCREPACGDGTEDQGEACDDGNLVAGDGCSADCLSDETCRNGVLDPGESCDDGNALSQDGCSSDCTEEEPVWTRFAPEATAPAGLLPPSSFFYDPARAEYVVDRDGETWVGSPQGWEQRARPPLMPIGGGASAWDARRARGVVVGGTRGGSSVSETWIWDGVGWSSLDAASPPSRTMAAMAYDTGRDRMVLFGGVRVDVDGTTTWYADLWELDGDTWTEVTPNAGPSPTAHAAMAYDPVRGEVVVHGGADDTDTPRGTATWDGATWSLKTPDTQPTHQVQSMIWDPSRERVLWSDTEGLWVWDGTDWARDALQPLPGELAWNPQASVIAAIWLQEVPSHWDGATLTTPSWDVTTPGSRWLHGAAWDSWRGEVAMVGGLTTEKANYWQASLDGPAPVAEPTWHLGAGGWHSGPAAPASVAPAVVYDPRGDALYAVAWDGTDMHTDVSVGGAWTSAGAVAEPTGRAHAAVGFDPVTGDLVLFGGSTAYRGGPTMSGDGLDYSGETWTFDGTTWSMRLPVFLPAARHFHSAVFDSSRGELAMTGGLSLYHSPNRVAWAGGLDWEIVDLQQHWGELAQGPMAWDPVRSTLVRVSGPSELPEPMAVAEYRDGDLQLDILADGPLTRPGASLDYHPLRRRMVLLGGPAADNVWEFGYGPVLERCVTGLDGDGDGLAGCDDPDCWAYCTPECAPDAPECSPEAPSCGDGTCNENLESPRLCPDDCGAPPVLCGDLFCDAGETACPGDCP